MHIYILHLELLSGCKLCKDLKLSAQRITQLCKGHLSAEVMGQVPPLSVSSISLVPSLSILFSFSFPSLALPLSSPLSLTLSFSRYPPGGKTAPTLNPARGSERAL